MMKSPDEFVMQEIQTIQRLKHPNKIVSSKYNILSFIPLNLFHQLSKPSTLFFFITAILQSIPAVSPFEPLSYIVALVIVMGISMIKDAIEDYNRHLNDRIINEKKCKIIVENQSKFNIDEKQAMDLNQGDWIILNKNEDVQADVVLVSGVRDGQCINYSFIDTQNLDGETNLKKKKAMLGTKCNQEKTRNNLRIETEICRCVKDMMVRTGDIFLDISSDLYEDFKCEIHVGGRQLIAVDKNVLFRGSILKNIDRVVGIVVGVGLQTKQNVGMAKTRKKKSVFEQKMDFLLFLVGLLYSTILAATTVFGYFMVYHNKSTRYILKSAGFKEVVCLFFSNYILYSYLIPLSLYVTLELARFFHARYVSFDQEMKINGIKSVCNNSNVIEDLGMVEYVLTDKTGTITKNSMTLEALHLPGNNSITKIDDLNIETNFNVGGNKLSIILLNILVCNSVEVLENEYQGMSQDELCFLKTLSKYGYYLLERDDTFVRIKVGNEEKRIEIVHTLGFTSKRQFMAVIIKYEGAYLILCKGSDQKLLNQHTESETVQIINNSGDYRSLVMRYKEISREQAIKLKERKEDLTRMCQEAEYIGTTFIEDELQEGVSETMDALHKAGIKVWMITGDKHETAVCCARNTGIISGLPYREMEGKDVVRALEHLMEIPSEDGEIEPGNGAEQNVTQPNLFDVDSLIIYRATPSQKGKITMLMVQAGKRILAVGDGNNDVAMLKGAHVGVGILGKEGTQASLCADFAIPSFRLLKNLILLHGRFNLIRYSKTSLNAFYKNILFILVQFFYNFANGASGRSIYNDIFMNYYNLLFTSMIPFTIALFDKDTKETTAIRSPDSYRVARTYFSRRLIIANIVFGLIEAIIIYSLIYSFTHMDMCNTNGLLCGFGGTSTLISIAVFFAVIIRQYRLISYAVWYSYAALFLSIILMLVFLFGVQNILSQGNSVIFVILSIPASYFIMACIIGTIFIIDVLFEVVCNSIFLKSNPESN